MRPVSRLGPRPVALETTLLVHGVPRDAARPLAAELDRIIRAAGADPALVGLISGRPTVGMTGEELDALLSAPHVPKANTANLGALIHARSHAATTVSATMELAAAAGLRVFATGGIGGVHPGYAAHLDISADLAALARFPVAVVASGVKSILDVESTREALETLGVPVVGYRTDRFPAFYLRESDAGVDWRFDDARDLAAFVNAELARTGRAVLVANPIPAEHAIAPADWLAWLDRAQRDLAAAPAGRDRTPLLLARLHDLSGGRTLAANLALVRANAALAASIATGLPEDPPHAPNG